MSGPPVVFLDANVLFSAALGGSVFSLLLDLGREGAAHLVTSRACRVEAEVNVGKKRPERQVALQEVFAVVASGAPAGEEHSDWAAALVHEGDVHVLAAARSVRASVLITGDVTHFGPLMARDDLPLKVATPREFLLGGPASGGRAGEGKEAPGGR